MATIVLIEGFEHEYKDTAVDGSSYINGISNPTQITFDTGRNGSGKSLKLAYDGLTATYYTFGLSTSVLTWTVFFKVQAGTNQSVLIRTTGPANVGLFRVGTDGSVNWGFSTGTFQSNGASLDDGNWHRMDAKVDVAGTTWTYDVRIDGVAQTQATIAAAGGAVINGQRIGGAASDTATAWWDDLVMSYTAADYPIGEYRITGYGPTADSATQSPGSTVFTSAAAQSSFYAEVDQLPGTPTTSTYIYQSATGSTDYANLVMADTSETSIDVVQGTVWYASSGSTSADNGTAAVYSDDTGSLLGNIYSGDMSDSATAISTRAAIIPPATTWSQTAFNNLRVRVGLSTDGNPNPQWFAVWLQVATPIGAGSTFTRTHTTDALIKATATRTHTTDAIKLTTSTRTHTTDAIKRTTSTKTHTTNAIVVNSVLKTHTTNAIVKKTSTKTHTTNAIVKKTFTKTHTTDGWIGTPTSPTTAHTTDAWIVGTPITHTTDALILSHLTQTHTTNAIVRRTTARQHSTDAYITAGGGLLQQTRTHFTNALIKKTLTRTHTTDALRLKPTTKTHTTNAYIGGRFVRDHTTDAVIHRSGVTRTHTTNAYIVGPSGGIGTWQADIYGAIGALGAPLAVDPDFKGLTATWVLDGPGSASIDLKEDVFLGSDPALWQLGTRRVQLSRNGTPMFTGYLTGSNGDHRSSPTHSETLSVSLLGCGSILDSRVVHGDFSSVDQVATTIAWDLIQHATAQESMGFTLGSVVGTAPSRTRYFCDGDVIKEAIDELAQKDTGGFDWEIDEELQFNAWVGGRGTDRSATYNIPVSSPLSFKEIGEASDVVTYVTAMGEDPDGPCGPPLSVQNQALSGFPRREVTITGEGQSTAELIDTALDELKARQKARLRISMTWDVDALPWDFGPTGVWLGDIIYVTPSAAFGGVAVKMRVIQVDVSLEQGQNEFMTYTFEMAS